MYTGYKLGWRIMNTNTILRTGNRKNVIAVLFAMSLSCCLLAILRVVWTDNITYIYLIWNLFLAWVPLIIADQAQRYYSKFPKRHMVLGFFFFMWLLFFPNSPYIITDLIHLDPRHNVPMWFDATLVFSFALAGLMTGFISLYFIHEVLNCFFKTMVNWTLITLVFLLTGYGIYLGRVLRWNSWDLFTKTKPLLLDITTGVFNPQALFMTFVFTFIMFFSYLILHSLIHLKHQVHPNDQNKQMY
jgi:uncharacterized membrane protein